MKSLNKALSLFLCFIIVLNMVPVVQGIGVSSEELALDSYTVRVISNEYTNEYVTIYEHEGNFFMSLNDIGSFTRSTLTEDDETLTLTHGLREIVISKADGHMVDSGIVDQGNITLLEYNGMYLCEGIPMLQYLGAACSIHEEKELEVLMPLYTIWESIMPDYLDCYFDINKLYGGENNVKISLVCDIIADVLDGVSGHGLFGSYDIHMEDALYEVLNVDMLKYSYVQQSAAEENQKINDFLTSDIYGFILEGSEKTVDGVYEVLDYYAGFYLNTEIWKNSYLEKLYFEAGDLKSASELGSQINKQVYTQSVMQADLKDVTANKSLLSVGMLAFDTAVTSYGLMQYDDDTRNLFARTINNDMIAHTNYHRSGWMSVSDKIANTLKSTESIVVNTAATKIAEFTMNEVEKYGVTKAVSAFTSKSNIYVAATQLGLYIASLINHNLHEAYSADMNAILINEAHFDIAMMASQLLVDERDKYHFSNPESLKRIKDMFTLYYRFVIAFSENVAISIDEFGGRDDQKWVDWFSSTEEWSVANYAADYLYRITNCTIVPYVEFGQLIDNVLSPDLVVKMTDYAATLILDAYREVLDMYYFGISSRWTTVNGDGWDVVCDPDNACYMFRAYYRDSSLSDIGYTFLDLDGSGSLELIVSPLDTADSGSIFDLYTINDNQIVHVFSAGERDNYNLAVDHSINNHGSGSAFSSGYDNYSLDGQSGSLVLNRAVIYDEYISSSKPWFFASTDYYNEEEYTYNFDALVPITEDEAVALKDKFPANQPLKLTPLSGYSPFSYSARSHDYYKALLAQYPATSKYESKTAYTVYDIDKNDIPELFVRIDHSTYYIFTIADSHLVFCGEFFWSYADCLYEYDANGIIIHSGGTGYLHLEHLMLYTLSEKNLEYSKTIISTEESTEEELYEKLRQLKKIDCTTHITDYSLFENRN